MTHQSRSIYVSAKIRMFCKNEKRWQFARRVVKYLSWKNVALNSLKNKFTSIHGKIVDTDTETTKKEKNENNNNHDVKV